MAMSTLPSTLWPLFRHLQSPPESPSPSKSEMTTEAPWSRLVTNFSVSEAEPLAEIMHWSHPDHPPHPVPSDLDAAVYGSTAGDMSAVSAGGATVKEPMLGLGAMNFISGTFGGFAGVLAGQPFDTVKVRLQVQGPNSAAQYKGTVDCFTRIVKEETVFGLFKGMSSPLVGVAMVNALLFGVYGTLLELQLESPTAVPALSQIFLAGAGSGAINSLISCPMELSKIKVQNQTDAAHSVVKTKLPHFNSPLHCLRFIYATQGVRGMYLGMGPTILRETPSYGTYFFAYEALCRGFARSNGHTDERGAEQALRPWQLMMAGGLSGIAGWMSTYPADVLKTKIQSADAGTYTGLVDCARQTIKAEGVVGLWRGAFATIVRAFPTNAATFYVWHLSMEMLKKV